MMLDAPEIRVHMRYWRLVLEQKSKDRFFSIDADRAHVGNCGIKNIKESGRGEVWIYLGDHSVRGQGIGRLAMAGLKQKARSMQLSELILHVRTDNAAANRLYRQEGFVVAEIGPAGSFGFGVDAEVCLMRTSL
ncbi:MAG: hypothetical protein TEF_03795 [Rhizobiales bacterium NRL2]|jgi:RimJ/RimL family protein N-acetyltransferase|nr:MAG: hypothetical protein TEF_03795 [Rhizobiales bacterium NRL2]